MLWPNPLLSVALNAIPAAAYAGLFGKGFSKTKIVILAMVVAIQIMIMLMIIVGTI